MTSSHQTNQFKKNDMHRLDLPDLTGETGQLRITFPCSPRVGKLQGYDQSYL